MKASLFLKTKSKFYYFRTMKNTLKAYWQNHPYRSILFLAIIIRLIAAVFSQGYAMHDDHFLIIESSASWAGDYDYNHWLPSSQIAAGIENPVPKGHSLFYPGLHYFFFEFANYIGIDNPKIQMLIIRIFHAFISLLVVAFSFKITEKLSSLKNAKIVGLCIAFCWAFPFYGVRNLVEMVCIPLFLIGIWQIVKVDLKDDWKAFLIAGILFGAAFSVRLQLAVFYLVFGLCMLALKKWRGSIALIVGFSIGAFFTQGIIDYFIWGRPFAELSEYISYNSGDSMYDYGGAWQWYKYFLVLAFFGFPILGFFWLFGMFKNFKKTFWLLLPLLGFTIFHTMYPNQQERFIFPVLPIFIILGVIGWQSHLSSSQFWKKRTTLWRGIKKSAWVINSIILLAAVTYATKIAKVNAAYFFYDSKITGKVRVLQEDSFGDDKWYNGDATLFPTFYAGNWDLRSVYINNETEREHWEKGVKRIDYVLLHGVKNIDKRIAYFSAIYPEMEIIETMESSIVDKILHAINPKNRNAQVTIIKTNELY